MTRHALSAAVLATASLLGPLPAAAAMHANPQTSVQTAMASAEIGIAKAIEAAKRDMPGKPISATFDLTGMDNSTLRYRVPNA